MSADPRGTESAADSRRWYLELSGRRAGPFAWTVIVELAQAGALGPDDRIWTMGLAGWSRTADTPDLVPLIRQPTLCARAFAPTESAGNSSAWGLHPLLLAAALAWIALTVTFFVEHVEQWPSVLDGVLMARLDTAGPLLLLLAGLSLLPGIWRCTRPDGLGRNAAVPGALRASAGVCVVLLLTNVIGAALGSRSLLLIATGSDPMGRAHIGLLPGGREIEIRGMLEAGVAARLEKALQAHPDVRFVHLNSRGGWITEGERLARIVHARRLGTYTATGCYSACVLAFAAGRPRVLNPDARLGLHSTRGLDGDPLFAVLGNELYQKVLRRYGVSPALVAWSTTTPAKSLWMPEPQQLLEGHLIDRVSAAGFGPSGESLSALARLASRFEARYPFLTELRQADPTRFEELDRTLRLGFRRGAPAGELNGSVAQAAGEVAGERLAEVADASALRFAVGLRGAARPFKSSDPGQCAAILGPTAAAAAARTAAALLAMSPALAALLEAPAAPRAVTVAPDIDSLQQVKETVGQMLPSAKSGGPRLDCDRLLLLYDTALTESPGTGAAFVRALQGR